MGGLSSIWESIEDAGSTITKGLDDTWDTIDQVYVDDFLGGLSDGVSSFSEKVYDVVRTEEWQKALAMSITKEYGGGEGAAGETSWMDYIQKGAKFLENMPQSEGQGQSQGSSTPSGMRSTNYSGLIGRLNGIITKQQIDPYEEIVIPTGARY